MAVFGQPWNPGKRRRSNTSTFEDVGPFQKDLSPSTHLPVHHSHQCKKSLVAGPPVNSSVAAYLRSQRPDWDLSKYINDDLPHPHAMLGATDAVDAQLNSDGRYESSITFPQASQTHQPPPSSHISFRPPRPRLQLLFLPTEVRLIILTHLLVSPTPICNPAKPRYPNTISHVSGSILATCRQIYAEGWPLLYHHNLFRFDLKEAYRLWTWPRQQNLKHCDIHHLDLSLDIATQSSMRRFVQQWPGAMFRWRKVNPMEEWKAVFAPWRHTELRTLKLTLRGYGLLPTDLRNNFACNTIKEQVIDRLQQELKAPNLHNVIIKTTGGPPKADRRDDSLAQLRIFLLGPHLIEQLGKALRSDKAEQKYLLYRDGGLIETLGSRERRIWDAMAEKGYCEGWRREMLILLQIKKGWLMQSRAFMNLRRDGDDE